MTRLAATFMPILLVVQTTAAQIVCVDDIQRSVRLPAPAQRIVSLAPSITESLFAIGADDQVCGVTDFCTYPSTAQKKAHVGGMTNPNIERIVNLKPDLILLSMEGNTRRDFEQLTSLGTPVFVSNPRNLGDIRHSIEQLGVLTGHEQEASALTASLQARAERVRIPSGSRRTTVLLLISLEPLFAAGRNTFIDDLLRHAGGENLAASAPGTYPALSREAVLVQDPAVIILTSDLAPENGSLLVRFPEWEQLTAARIGRVYRIDPDLVSRPGPRALDGLELLSHFLHTDIR